MLVLWAVPHIVTGATRGHSPSGHLTFECVSSGNGGGAKVYLWETKRPQTRRVIYETDVLFVHDVKISPDENWIAVEWGGGSAGHDIALLKKRDTLDYEELDKGDQSLVDEVADLALKSSNHSDLDVDHAYLRPVRWFSDSRTLLLRLGAYGSGSKSSVEIRNWRCSYNVETGKLSLLANNPGRVKVTTRVPEKE